MVIVLAMVANFAKGQITVNSAGQTGIGCSPVSGYTLSTNNLLIANSISAGYQSSLGFSQNPFYVIHGAFHYASSYYTYSDSRLKQNFRKIESPLNRLLQINGLKYDFKSEKTDTIKDEKEKEKQLKLLQNKLGFLAQDVEAIFPEAIFYDKEIDKFYIEYNAFIPLIVEAMKEQQTKIDDLANEITNLKSSDNLKSASISDNASESGTSLAPGKATLSQNIPNPFSSSTRIGITLPETVKTARLYVYNMQGVQIKSFDIIERGATSVTIEGYTLQAGMYLYTLIADGKEVDTKKMILTKN
jgi:hypothetical protein